MVDLPALRGLGYGKSMTIYPDYVLLADGLQYKDLRVGEGNEVKTGDNLLVDWDGVCLPCRHCKIQSWFCLGLLSRPGTVRDDHPGLQLPPAVGLRLGTEQQQRKRQPSPSIRKASHRNTRGTARQATPSATTVASCRRRISLKVEISKVGTSANRTIRVWYGATENGP
jgi:hypothetical protein